MGAGASKQEEDVLTKSIQNIQIAIDSIEKIEKCKTDLNSIKESLNTTLKKIKDNPTSKQDLSGQDSSKQDPSKQDPSDKDPSKQDPSKQVPSDNDLSKEGGKSLKKQTSKNKKSRKKN